MRLRTKKRLLRLASLGIFLLGGGIVYVGATRRPPDFELEQTPVAIATDSERESAASLAPDPKQPYWRQPLRKPLYDPPPEPKPKVVKRPRPITVSVVGTVIEPENSQVFLRQQNQQVDLKQIGDPVTSDPRDGEIAEITATGIVIRREDGLHPLQIESAN